MSIMYLFLPSKLCYMMHSLVHYPKTITFLLVLLHLILRRAWVMRRRSNLPLPPGPKGYPLLGNFLDFPTRNPAQAHSQLLHRYGDMVYLESFGTKMLILGSVKRTTDLLEKRSSIYSDRPESPMLFQMGFDAVLSLMPYGIRWRRQRKMFHEQFNPTVVSRYRPLILEERSRYIQALAEKPDEFWEWSKLYFSRIILRAAYGIDPKGKNDLFLTKARIAVDGLNEGGRTGAYMVDFIPALKYVPDWMPGTGWKRVAREYREKLLDSRVAPFEHVLQLHRQGVAAPSAALSLIQKLPDEDAPGYAEELLCAQDAMAIAFAAGADTTVGIVLTTLLLLAMHPDIQKRAQDEIDRVVGRERLPDFGDRDELVYLNALLKEVSRLYQVTPLAVPHALLEDDVYDGYFIPKRTIVIGNSWHILHDLNVYPDPFTFNPDRFIKDGQLDTTVFDPHAASFGFGRRICPGRHFSHDTLFALVSAVLASFTVSPPKDENGYEVPLKWEFEEQLVIHPKQFDCLFTPRSAEHLERFGRHATSNT